MVTRALLAMGRDSAVGDRGLARRICEACVAGLDIDGAALSLLTASESRQTLWATDATAELLEDLQFTLGEGACIDAALTGAAVLVPDLSHSTETTRWPIFAASVAERTEVGALFALPLQWGAVNLGVLDLYRRVPGGLSQVQWLDALDSTETASLMLLGQRTDPGGDGDGWLDPAIGNRAEIHQATGMVLVQLGVSASEALARMRGYAFVTQRLLIDVARDVVAGHLRFEDTDT